MMLMMFPDKVLCRIDLTPADKLVYGALDARQTTADEVAAALGLGVRSVYRSISRLRHLRLLTVTKLNRQPSLYRHKRT